MVALAVTFSQAACALGSFLHQKSMPRKLYLHIPGESTVITEKGSKTAQKIFESLQRFQNRDKSSAYNSFLEQGGLGMALLSTTAMAKDRISPVIATLCANPTFMSGLVAWTLAQALKVFTTFFVEKRWDFKMLLGSGGMPSSHSALCVALTTSVAVCHGLSDALFPVCLGFSLIVMYDATGVRRHAGMQAEVLNLIVEDLFKGHPVREKKLKELLGHTPLQVGAGAMVGMLAGYFCSQGYSVFPGHGI